MTTVNMESAGVADVRGGEEIGSIMRSLEAAGNRFRLAAIVAALGRFLAIVIPWTTLILFAAGFLALPTWLNIGLLAVTAALWSLAYARLVHGAVFHRPTYAQIARMVEEHGAGTDLKLHNELINAVLLANDWEQSAGKGGASIHGATTWIPHVLRELAARTQGMKLEAAVPWKAARNAVVTAGLLILLCAVLVLAFPATFAHGLAVFSRPGHFVPVRGTVRILAVTPGNDTVLAGQSVNFTVTLQTPGNKVVPTTITMKFASGKTATYPMSIFGTENSQYRYQLPTAAEDIDYVVTAGQAALERSQSEQYHLAVLPQIHMVAFKLDATPPKYTGKDKLSLALAGKEATAARGSVEVPTGSRVTLGVTLDIPAKEVLLDVQNGSPVALLADADGRTFTGTLTVKDSLKYAVRVNDSANRTLRTFPAPESAGTDPAGNATVDGAALQYAITATPDQPPTITVSEPGKELDAKPGDKVELTATAVDDYGLKEISLEVAKNSEQGFRVVQKWPLNAGAGAGAGRGGGATIKHVLELPAGDYRMGDSLRYRFVATDNRDLTSLDPALGPQTTPSQVFTIHFNDTAAAAAKTTALWDQLRKELTALLDQQIALRKQAAALNGQTALDDMRKLVAPISKGQVELRARMSKLANEFPFEPSMKLVQKSLQVLVLEDAASAVDRCSDMLLLSETRPLPALAMKLRQNEDRVIDVLQTLLAIAQANEKHPAMVMDKAGEDMPGDAGEAWKKIAGDLKKFEKDQKSVIDATAELAKKPKDAYDAKDNQKMADLAAVEDKWEKFLNDRLADMSKIAEQDQANASLLDEMVQMKVELAAAKDALEQKATQVATPLEENGLENAQALDTHIERMLMNKPDHTAWQMEEAVTQNDQAMAELPKQLQDMMGDLMDKEEDLTDEMESVGSKFADSINKGAGWDAADGPISNMSAQGVTGNQLPKNDEIQGRSGEGREGRSSGEFVGAEAEGKGGRRTPTRMTDDPFSSGQVKDNSKEPAGGATGGGKKGGFGGEGLEGQAPPELQNTMKRLAGAQAALRNQAERINLQMHATGFNNFKLIEADVLLHKSQDALRAYRYHTAMYYQQKAVDSLNTAKVLSEGQMHVTLDTTPEVSETTRKEIESAMKGAMPRGYADPVKAYFENLATDQSSAKP